MTRSSEEASTTGTSTTGTSTTGTSTTGTSTTGTSTTGRSRVRLDGARIADRAATLVRAVTLLFAATLVVNIVLTVAGANPEHPLASFVRGGAASLSLGLDTLFVLVDKTIELALNQGIAAIGWIVIGILLAKLVRVLVPRSG